MPKPRARLTTTVAASTAALMLLSACGGDSESSPSASSSSSPSSSSSSSSSASSGAPTLAEPKPEDAEKVKNIKVKEGSKGEPPKVELPKTPLEVSETTLDVLEKGEGKKPGDGAYVKLDMAMFSGKDGKPIKGSETYSNSPVVLDLNNPGALPGLVKAIKGQPVGTHGVAVMPPKDLFGKKGMPQFGISGDDNLVLVYDVRGILPEKAQGEKVEPEKGMPKVDFKDGAPADITIPEDAKKPEELKVQPLIEGDGETVKKGDTVYVHYTGVSWKDGKVFDSSLKKGRAPFSFPVGQGRVIPAWDKALEGAQVGDRLLIVAPPDQAYGKKGTPDGSIKPNSTLVFVVDVLGSL